MLEPQLNLLNGEGGGGKRTRRGGTDFSFVQNKVLAVQVTDAICWTGEEARSNSLPNRDSQKKV